MAKLYGDELRRSISFADAVTDWLVDEEGLNAIDVAERIADLWAASAVSSQKETP
jgi:hypothetical protein